MYRLAELVEYIMYILCLAHQLTLGSSVNNSRSVNLSRKIIKLVLHKQIRLSLTSSSHGIICLWHDNYHGMLKDVIMGKLILYILLASFRADPKSYVPMYQ